MGTRQGSAGVVGYNEGTAEMEKILHVGLTSREWETVSDALGVLYDQADHDAKSGAHVAPWVAETIAREVDQLITKVKAATVDPES